MIFFFPLPALLFSDSLSHFPIHEGSRPKVNPSGSHLMAAHWQVILVVFAFFFFPPSRLTGVLGDELELGEF